MTREDAAIIVGNIPVNESDDCCTIAEYQEAKAMAIKELEQSCDDTAKSIATAFQFGVAMGFAKKYDEMDKVMEEVKKAIIPERESCDDCISRQVAIDAFERFIHELGIEDEPYNYGEMALSAKNVPSVTPQPKEGHWIDADGDNAICGCCNRLNHLYGTYCKHCGAKMYEL